MCEKKKSINFLTACPGLLGELLFWTFLITDHYALILQKKTHPLLLFSNFPIFVILIFVFFTWLPAITGNSSDY
jgi:hypothetical protein